MQQRFTASAWWCVAFFVGAWATDKCTSTNGFTIASQADADVLSKCSEYTGDVLIASKAHGNITIDGLVTLHGRLSTAPSDSIESATKLIGFSSKTIETIDGDLSITNLKGLELLDLPALTTVGGDVRLQSLPALVNVHLEQINSVASLSLVSLPGLRSPSIGLDHLTEGSSRGLKHITSTSDPKVEVRDVGFVDLGGIMDNWNASLFSLEDAPNLNELLIIVGRVGEVRIRGNGNLTLHMPEKGWVGDVVPVMEKLSITGIKHISPCLHPEVWDFVAINNTVKYLRFGFKGVRRLEIRDNPNMKRLLPFNGQNLWEWNLSTMVVQDNPLLELVEYPSRAADDILTLGDCPYMFNNTKDQWQWYPFSMETISINARVENSFL